MINFSYFNKNTRHPAANSIYDNSVKESWRQKPYNYKKINTDVKNIILCQTKRYYTTLITGCSYRVTLDIRLFWPVVRALLQYPVILAGYGDGQLVKVIMYFDATISGRPVIGVSLYYFGSWLPTTSFKCWLTAVKWSTVKFNSCTLYTLYY